MASLRTPVPSAGLLRFLRSQSENLSFFSPNNAPAPGIRHVTRRAWCAAKRRAQEYSRLNQTLHCQRGEPLQAGILDLNSLLQPRSSRASPGSRVKNPKLSSQARIGVRYACTDEKKTTKQTTWQERIWGMGSRKPAKPLEPDDLPNGDGDGENNSMFNIRRQLSQKAALEPRLRCTEVDETGNVIVVDGEFKKSELIARVRFGSNDQGARENFVANMTSTVWSPTPRLA